MSTPEMRAEQYGVAGRITALTAIGLGTPIPDDLTDRWVDTSARLPAADDVSEEDPNGLTAESLLNMLNIQEVNPALTTAADELLAANCDSLRAPTINEYFDARTREALGVTDLLRYQAPKSISGNEKLWDQLGMLVIFGIHNDSLLDCREDARQLPQFSARQIAGGALINMFRAGRRLKPRTVLSFARACHDTGVDYEIIKKMPKPLLGTSS